MTHEDYQETLRQYYQAAEFVWLISNDAAKILADIEHAESVGAILDPTAWIRNHRKMAQDKVIVEAVLRFRNAFTKLKEEAEKESTNHAQAK
jgi:hypothetical protein